MEGVAHCPVNCCFIRSRFERLDQASNKGFIDSVEDLTDAARERIFLDLITSDHKLKASRKGSK